MNSNSLYPLRFEPIYQYRLWGGRRLANLLSAPLPGDGPIGEAWLLSDRDDHPSRVANGPLKGRTITQLFHQWAEQLLGKLAGRFRRFPLLLKFLDVRGPLSVQVHPSDQQTKYLPVGETGKTEAWVVLEAGAKSRIYAGLKPAATADTLSRNDAVAATGSCDAPSQKVGATPPSRDEPGTPFGLADGSGDEASPARSATGASQLRTSPLHFSIESFRLRQALANGTVADQLASFTPKPGDGIFIPAGTVHSLGDVVVFEVQQNSDVTFRLYDWNHVDARTGQPRPLQVDQAMACIDFAQGAIGPVAPMVDELKPVLRERLFDCEHFGLWRFGAESPFGVGAERTPRVLVCLAGDGQVEHDGANYAIGKGDVLLLPAVVGACLCRPRGAISLLEISLPEGT